MLSKYAIIILIILLALFMAYRRMKSNEKGYVYAWLACALINAVLLVRLMLGA